MSEDTNEEKFVELSQATETKTITTEEELEPSSKGRCRIYNSNKEKIGCKNVSSENDCASWASYKSAWAYGWAPYKEC